jgi:hypothetical protein
MEAISLDKDVLQHVEASRKSSKREFKDRNLELSKEHTVKRKKIEREKERLASSKELEAKPFERLTTSYDAIKIKAVEKNNEKGNYAAAKAAKAPAAENHSCLHRMLHRRSKMWRHRRSTAELRKKIGRS